MVAGQPDEDLLGLFTRQELRSRRAAQLWQELVGSEVRMEARELGERASRICSSRGSAFAASKRSSTESFFAGSAMIVLPFPPA